uniref:Eukaryotic translation initiation factor 3 subunit G n=1 Tax=Panagrolaimus sp. JU765 TaxID=591449 RepID=A0AC34QNJ4_9BILA
MATANVELPAVNSIGSWAEAVEEDVRPMQRQRTETSKDGIRTVTDYIKDEQSGALTEVTATFKLIHKKVPKVVAERKQWTKFGQSANDGPGPHLSTTYVAEEVQMQFTKNRSDEEQAQVDVPIPGLDRSVGTKAHCRICKANDHWSVNCPYKEIMLPNGEEEENRAGAAATGNRYVPPTQRGDRALGMSSERRDDYTVRVTNLPEDDDNIEEELRHAFNRAGRIDRLYVARDKQTLRIKGFAFVTYTCREDAERAIEMFRGFKMGHLILKVEWTKPSNN